MEPQQEGTTRALTPGEVNLARSVFGSTIFYQSVLVHCDSYLPFGLQNQYTAMSPNGSCTFVRLYTDLILRCIIWHSTCLSTRWHMFGSIKEACGCVPVGFSVGR